jgi:hypothetical protein
MRDWQATWRIDDQYIAHRSGIVCEWASYSGVETARLIAAAPELLMALNEVLDDLDDPNMPEISAATISRARQAVAKAGVRGKKYA